MLYLSVSAAAMASYCFLSSALREFHFSATSFAISWKLAPLFSAATRNKLNIHQLFVNDISHVKTVIIATMA